MVGRSMMWSGRSGRTAVPMAKNSVGVRAPGVAVLPELDTDDALGVQFLRLGLHPAHGQLAGIVEGLGELLDLHVPADVADLAAELLVRDVVHARPHHHAERRVAGPDQRPEVLAGQVRGERLALVVTPVVHAAAARARFGLDRRADRDEFGDVGAELLHLHVQPDPDDAVGAAARPPRPPSGSWPARARDTWPGTARRAPGCCPSGRSADRRGRSSCRAPARAGGTRPRAPAGTR